MASQRVRKSASGKQSGPRRRRAPGSDVGGSAPRRSAAKARARAGAASSRSHGNGRQQAGILGRTAEGVKDVGNKAVDTVKQHPVSAAMVGAGVVGLAVMAVVAASSGSGTGARGRRRGGEDEKGGLTDRAREWYGSIKENATHLGESIEEGYVYSKDTLGILWENHPLAVGTGILALGVAAGMLLPASRVEGSLLGGAVGQFTERLASAGKNWLEQGTQFAGRVAAETGNAIRSEAEQVGLTPAKITRKVKRIAGKVKKVIGNVAE